MTVSERPTSPAAGWPVAARSAVADDPVFPSGAEGRPPASSRRWPSGSAGLLALGAAPLVLLLTFPLAAFLARTPPATLAAHVGSDATRQALALSLLTSTASLGLVIGFGTPLAYLLARRRFAGRGLLDVLIDLPTVLPPAVAGIALLMAFGRRGVLGQYLDAADVHVAFTPVAVVLAQTFVAAPYYVKSAAVGLAAVGPDLLESAAVDGAGPPAAFRHVTLPLASRGLVGGAALCWSRALGEFGATIVFAGNYPGRTQTMPLAVYLGFEVDLDQALTLAAILLVISFGLLSIIRATLRNA